VEAFVRDEGKITRMEEEFSLSYPTIRSRLHEVIKALGIARSLFLSFISYS
jgi:hypothetical protein